ncbi:putative leader peptide [Jatrophihabitans sp. GAS493]
MTSPQSSGHCFTCGSLRLPVVRWVARRHVDLQRVSSALCPAR